MHGESLYRDYRIIEYNRKIITTHNTDEKFHKMTNCSSKSELVANCSTSDTEHDEHYSKATQSHSMSRYKDKREQYKINEKIWIYTIHIRII